MAITGTTNTCEITTNTQFVLSGLSETNLSTINITDENGLDISECFGIKSRIVTVVGDNITLTGDCDTSLEITITSGVSKPVECNFIEFTQDETNFLTFYFIDGSTSDNTHPDCCTGLGFTPEIGPDGYFICRWRDEIDITDCKNYQSTGTFDESLHQIFEFAGGGNTTVVPSAECCYVYGLIEEVLNGEIYCVEDIPFNPCDGLIVVEPTPDFGIIEFSDPTTGSITTTVKSSECCTSNGFSFQVVETGFQCFNSLTSVQPMVNVSLDATCCDATIV
tara:strand:+ start:2351 stop:3184 length:834 start_codon:yes stop_codon:yes gene_type:complete